MLAWFYCYLATFYVKGDILAYSHFFDIVSTESRNGYLLFDWDGFFRLVELQRACVGAREPAFGAIVWLISLSGCSYYQYQCISIALFVACSLAFLRRKLKMGWTLAVLTLLGSYFFVMAIPAERVKWAAILIFLVGAFRTSDSGAVWGAIVSSFAHIQVGIAGFSCLASRVRRLNLALLGVVLACGVVSAALMSHLQHKVGGKLSQASLDMEHSVTSAILGTALVCAMWLWGRSSPSSSAVLAMFWIVGMLVGFNRLNMVIWMFFVLTYDNRNMRAKWAYGCFAAFFAVRMLRMAHLTILHGTAFPG